MLSRRWDRATGDAPAKVGAAHQGNLMLIIAACLAGMLFGGGPAVPEAGTVDPALEALRARIDQNLQEQGTRGHVGFATTPEGLVVRLDSGTLFDSGQAVIQSGAVPVLDAIAEVLTQSPHSVRIEGHTDSDPMAPDAIYPDNWTLSAARATSVLRYLHEFHQIAYPRLSTAGFADTRPVASNDSAEGKQRNRRVDLVILRRRP